MLKPSRIILWTLLLVFEVQSKAPHHHHHPKNDHKHHQHLQARNKRSELSTESPNFGDKFCNRSEKSLKDLEKLFGPIPENLLGHIRVKRNNKNYLSSASSDYLKKLADSFAGPAQAENNQEDNLEEEVKNDKQEDVRRKREIDEEIFNFFPEDSKIVNLIRTKRFGDPDKKIKLNKRNDKKKSERLKRLGKKNGKGKIKKNSKVKKNISKEKLKMKRCSRDKNKNKKKNEKSNGRVKRRPEESLPSLEEIRDLAANLVSKVDELEGSVKINRRSGRNPHGYKSRISNSKRSRILGARHSASDLSNPPGKFKHRAVSRRRRRKKNRRKMMRRMNRNRNKLMCKKGENNKKWARWTDWSSCSVSCGKGRQIRWRHCRRNCKNAETEMEEKTCQLPACAPARLFGIF